ncbi:MAG TPA: DUF1361 domain-containing protein [Chitinophagaceae bacterium]|nr:DUF1361 domain-containing protein [Chitinophagaceae bacterium]
MINMKFSKNVNLSASGTFHQWLLLSSCFSGILLLARMIVTDTIEYIFLPWNLFLAFIPYWITRWMIGNVKILESRVKLLAALGTWLLFIPNSFYIVTDLFHLTHVDTAPKWFDLLLIFSFTWNGILAGVISLRRVEIITCVSKGKNFSLVVIFFVMWLNAFGIYIGRFLRFNSWDIITDPFSLFGEIMDMITHPVANGYAWGMTLCYAVFMTFVYLTIKKLSESLFQ